MDLLGIEKELKAFLIRMTISLDKLDALVDESRGLVADIRALPPAIASAVQKVLADGR